MSLVKSKTAVLWHAYNALKDHGKPGAVGVAKGQLKVFTHNLATSLGRGDAVKAFDEQLMSDYIEFPEYLTFLDRSLFQPISDTEHGGEDQLDKVDQVCWFICSKVYVGGTQNTKLLDKDIYKLWRIFNTLLETTDDQEICLPVVVSSEETEVFVHRLGTVIKSPVSYSNINDDVTCNFARFLNIIETEVAGRAGITAAISQLYDEIVANVLRKGYLNRRVSHTVTTNTEQHWYVLTPSCFKFFTKRDDTEKKGEFAISHSCRVENLSDKAGIAIGSFGIGAKMNRFALHLADGSPKLEFAAPDAETKSEWIHALQTAIDWTGPLSNPYRSELEKRRRVRMERRVQQQREEERKRLEMERIAQMTRELELERQAREAAERQRDEEAKLREIEQQRINELEQLYRKLEELLEQERRAKRDEEIVRNLQARVLQEEFERREKLEEMKADLEKLLLQEHEKAAGLEERRREQEMMLREEQERLQRLEEERCLRDQEYQMAVWKLQEAEQAKEQMQDELKRKEEELQKRHGGGWLSRARQGSTDSPGPSPNFVSHRGLGAFSPFDFVVRSPPHKNSSSSSPTASSTSPKQADALDTPPTPARRTRLPSTAARNAILNESDQIDEPPCCSPGVMNHRVAQASTDSSTTDPPSGDGFPNVTGSFDDVIYDDAFSVDTATDGLRPAVVS